MGNQPYNSDDKYYQNLGINNNEQYISGVQKILNSICEIIINNNIKGLGFLISLPINMGDRYLYGLLTSNLILSKNELNINQELILNFKNSKNIFKYTILQDTFIFTCPFLDVTFLEIPLNTFKSVEYLRIWEEPIKGQELISLQLNTDNKIHLTNGKFEEFYGYYLIYKLNSSYPNLICSPIISLDKNSLGDVIGICQNQLVWNNNKYSAININIVLRGIKALIHQNRTTHLHTASFAKKLSLIESHILEKEGLKSTDNPDVFISPGSLGITPLWFFRTQYAWYWTPKEPKKFNLDEMKKVNWSLIQSNFPIKAIGGLWNGMAPANRNVILIQFLINSGLRFLAE